jgi:hypothetical protein
VGKPARDLRALGRDVVTLRADIEHYRAELREVVDRFLDEYGVPGAGARLGVEVDAATLPQTQTAYGPQPRVSSWSTC